MFILDLINREVAKIDIEHENFILNFLSSLMKVLRLYVVCRNDSIIIAQRYRHDRYKDAFFNVRHFWFFWDFKKWHENFEINVPLDALSRNFNETLVWS